MLLLTRRTALIKKDNVINMNLMDGYENTIYLMPYDKSILNENMLTDFSNTIYLMPYDKALLNYSIMDDVISTIQEV